MSSNAAAAREGREDGARDIRASVLFREVEASFAALHAPGTGVVSDAADISIAPDGRRAAVTATIFEDLASAPVTRVALIDLGTRDVEVVAAARNSDRLPRFSPNGRWLAFLSDRREAGSYQLCILDLSAPSDAVETADVDGSVEYFHWAPDGRKVLLGVAGRGADLAGCQGGAKIAARREDLPGWMPFVDTGDAENLWRSLYVCDVEAQVTEKASPDGLNYWEGAWLGNDAWMSVVSDSHSEGSWYRSTLVACRLGSDEIQTIFEPSDQIGLPSASPSGTHVTVVEAVCSDRLIVCGTLHLVDPRNDTRAVIDTDGIEVTHVAWRDDRHFVYSGHRGFETVVAEHDLDNGTSVVHWQGTDRTFGSWYPSSCPWLGGGAAAIGESWETAPELVRLVAGRYEVVRSFASESSRSKNFHRARAEPYRWKGRDGLEIQGWLVRPPGDGPFPLVMDIHGGPVWHCRNRWAGRLRGAKVLADHGIASLYPNPRGSSGRGQDFARLVKGDMGGEDTHDYLRACDALVADGIADPTRLGVTGISYGGFASAWLITQDDRFVAAAPISPVTNWYSQHRTSQIPFFDELFLDGSASEPGGRFFERSPAMFAANVSTPTLQLTGAQDQNTPPTQALEFHRSLLEHGVTSVLVTYPTAGHGIRTFPEVIDATTRYVGWFLEHFRLRAGES